MPFPAIRLPWQRLPWAAFAAASAHGLRMLVNLTIIKMISVALGPSGLGAMGNLISVLSVLMVFAGGGISNGIAKYVAEHQGRTRETLRLLETAFALGISISGVVLIISVLAARQIAAFLFGGEALWWLSPVLGLSHFACFIGTATIAVANGQRRPDLFAAISISAYVGCIPAAFLLIWLFGFAGGALALMLMAGCTALPSLWVLARAPVRRLVRLRFHRRQSGRLLRFSAMTLASALTFPLAETIIRNTIIGSLGLSEAGIWQASIRLSGAILGFYTVYLATGYMPHLSSLRDSRAALRFVLASIVRIGAIFLLVAIAVYLLRQWVVPLLFSSAFKPLEPLLAWQLLGDAFRVCAYVIGFFVVARARVGLHIAAEVTQYSIYAGISIAIVHAGGSLSDVVRGYTLSFGIYFALALAWLGVYGRRLQ